jgi:signal transduction histidine kinase
VNGTAHRRREPAWLAAAVLAVALAVVALLAVQAWLTTRSHRRAAEGALRDYAAFAAWQYGREAVRRLDLATDLVLSHARAARIPVRPDALLEPAREAARCGCGPLLPARTYFRLDLKDGTAIFGGALPDEALREWLADTLGVEGRRRTPKDGRLFFVFKPGTGAPRGIAYTLGTGPDSTPRFAYGLEIALERLGDSILVGPLRSGPLLPPSLTDSAANDSVVTVEVFDPFGRTILGARTEDRTSFSALDTLPSRFGGLVVRTTLRPAVLPRLVIGGLPRSRPALLAGLVAAATLLLGCALWLIHRERELAILREDFVSSVSHELRTPLAQIMMDAETLQLGRVRTSGERREAVTAIVQEARRLRQLVENVLQFSRSRRLSVEPGAPRPISPAVADTVRAFAPLAGSNDTHILTELEAGVEAAVEPDALRRLLLNLLENAVKYGPRGQQVRVGVTRRDGRVRIEVDDQGPGIPAAERERVFEPFVRLDRHRDGVTTGSGLGLAVVREIAVQHGGRVWVEDAPGRGARVVVELPAAAPARGR